MTNHIRRRLLPATAAVNNWLTQQNLLQLLLSSSADMQKTTPPSTPTSPSQPPPFKLRLHLIRHGETIANVQNIVLGQGDSPLTSNGVAVAQMFYNNYYSKVVDRDFNNNNNNIRGAATTATGGGYYWRTYCSDLHRAHRTAKIALGLEDVHGNELLQQHRQQQDSSQDDSTNNSNSGNNNTNLIVDPRLRELAKGAREGYRKSFSYEEALEARRAQQASSPSLMSARTTAAEQQQSSEELIDIPLLESADDAWIRVKDWIDSLVVDAAIEHHDDVATTAANNTTTNSNINKDTTTKIYNVFTLSHSALIRTMIYKMAEAQLSSFQYEFNSEGKLWLPNLSRTVIDICPSYHCYDYVLMKKTNKKKEEERIGSYSSSFDDYCSIDGNDKDLMNVRRQGRIHDLRWSCNLVDLADVSHLSNSDDDDDDDSDLCHG